MPMACFPPGSNTSTISTNSLNTEASDGHEKIPPSQSDTTPSIVTLLTQRTLPFLLFRMRRVLFLCGLITALAMSPFAALAFTVFDSDGTPNARIFLKPEEDPLVEEAASELASFLQRMNGKVAQIQKTASAKSVPSGSGVIALGKLADELGLAMNRHSAARDGFRYKVDHARLLLVGETPQGVLHGAYDLLERLGCGWFAPGTIGEVVPSIRKATLPDSLDYTGLSDSVNRRFWYGGKGNPDKSTQQWITRNKAEFNQGSWNHSWHGLVSSKEHFAAHPEYFSLNRGKRTTKQLCTTNPETVRIASESLLLRMQSENQRVFAAGPNDGGNLCECPTCAKLDSPGYFEPTSGQPSCADRIFGFAGTLASITSKQFPEKDLGILVYSEYSRPPVKLSNLHPNVFPMIAPIRRCRFHGPNNPACESSRLLGSEIAAWGALSKKIGFYAYNYNLADALVPLSKISYYKRLADSLRQTNPVELAWIFESIDSWSAHAPHFYLCTKLAWSSTIDVDAEMERYFTGFYAESAVPMRRYWQRLDSAYDKTPVHVGSQYGLHQIWTPDLLAKSRADIAEARTLAKSDRVKQTIALADAGLRNAELFMEIWNHIGACEFAKAAQSQNALKAHIDSISAKTDPNWIHERYAWGYYTRFVGLTVDAGAAALADGGQLIAQIPETWRTLKDPERVGTSQKWWTPEMDDSRWEPMQTFNQSWADYGLAHYHGDLWYRSTFTLPTTLPEGDLRLWFGGFDYDIEVFLNGNRLGGWLGFAKPAEFADIRKHLKPGANQITIRVSSGDLGELGTGGLMMPSMIYRWNGKSVLPTGKKGVEYIQ